VRILVIQTAFLGDAVLATALVVSLAAAYPEAELHLLVRKGHEGMLAGHPMLHKVWVWDKGQKYQSLLTLIKAVRKAGFTAVICVQRFAAMGLLTAVSGAKIRSGFVKNPFSWAFSHTALHKLPGPDGQHETARNHALLAPFAKAKPALPFLAPTAAARAETAPYLHHPYICIAPASVWATKQVPVATWAKLIKLSIEKEPDVKIWLLGGQADTDLAEQVLLLANVGAGAGSLAGKLSIMGSAALLSAARRLYANDSGPIHLASAVGCPATAVFCSTVPSFGFGPLAPGSRVVQETIGLPCRPCGLHGKKACPEGHFLCGKLLEANAIYTPYVLANGR